MNLAISNIAWDPERDFDVYALMKQFNINGLEIAPTRIFPKSPYSDLAQAEAWAHGIDFYIPSMQSIWYGLTENIFIQSEQDFLLSYTKEAINFASCIGCKNLVFGCPKNRNKPKSGKIADVINFFREIGNYAISKSCVIGIEANPTIYNTNFINSTKEAIALIRELKCPGIRLNLDLGTMIHNNENILIVEDAINLISHVHVSEPYLKQIEKRAIHKELAKMLKQHNYQEYISIEMGRQENIDLIQESIEYIKETFS